MQESNDILPRCVQFNVRIRQSIGKVAFEETNMTKEPKAGTHYMKINLGRIQIQAIII